MASGFKNKPCPQNSTGRHDWGTRERPVYDKNGQAINSVKFTACKNCGNQP